MTLSYNTPSGQPHQTTLFFKLNPDDSREAQRYRFLTAHDVAVPHLEVCVEREDEEVLGLQFLPSVGTGPADVDDVLRLVASLNSLTHVPAGVGSTPPGLPRTQFELLIARTLERISSAHPDHEAATWFDTYRRAALLYRQLPTALTHGELAPQQLGRTEEGALVMFDLATTGLRPRLADIAQLLTTLAQLAGTDERTILGGYLSHLTRQSRATTPLDEQIWAELRLTRFVQGIEALPWHLNLNEPGELHQQLLTIAADHHAALAQLSP